MKLLALMTARSSAQIYPPLMLILLMLYTYIFCVVTHLHPEHVWRVHPRQHPELERLVPVLCAPDVGRAHPEELPLAVALQAGQELLLATGAGHPVH